MRRANPAGALAIVLTLAAVASAAGLTPQARARLIAHAQVWTPTDISRMDVKAGPQGPGAFSPGETVACDFEEGKFEGRSPKFRCRLKGELVKVKYGKRNGEVPGEVAATRLLWALGFGADRMYPVRIRCRGCPTSIGEPTDRDGERLVEPAVIERSVSGGEVPEGLETWGWTELEFVDEDAGGAPRAQRDALKLLAAFLQHSDSKPEQQRLACLDGPLRPDCKRPFMMLNDLGLTFGAATFTNANSISSVNLGEWSRMPIWKHPIGCVANLPKSFTGTLRDPIIREEGRLFLSRLLERLSDAQLRDLFEVAGVEARRPTASTGTIDAWIEAFRVKRRQITERRCVEPWSAVAPTLFDTDAIVRIQAHGSPQLTAVMNIISTFGYSRAFMAIAVLIALAYNLRAGASLLLLIALTGVLSDAAKVAANLPRPDAVDSRVRALTDVPLLADAPNDSPTVPSVDDDDVYGFPSGHVATTMAFLLGLALLADWRGAWPTMALVVPLMAFSRLYLGRHFVADILGGVCIALVATAIIVRLRLWRLGDPARRQRTALRVAALGVAGVLLAISLNLPPPREAGRLVGVSAAIVLLALRHRMAGPPSSASASMRVGLAALLFAVTWWGTSQLLFLAGVSASRAGELARFPVLSCWWDLSSWSSGCEHTRDCSRPSSYTAVQRQ
jgi:membrane-associated phospholipid phosphatase